LSHCPDWEKFNWIFMRKFHRQFCDWSKEEGKQSFNFSFLFFYCFLFFFFHFSYFFCSYFFYFCYCWCRMVGHALRDYNILSVTIFVVDISGFSFGTENRFRDLQTRLALAINPCRRNGVIISDYHAYVLMDTLYLNTAAFPYFRCLKCLKWEAIEQLMEQLWPWPFSYTVWCQFF